MTTTPVPSTGPSTGSSIPPLLHPRLARLDPSRHRPRGHGSRLGLLAGTLGTCLTITFAAHALQGPLPAASPAPARTLARSAQVLVSGV